MAYRMTLQDRAIRFMIRMSSIDTNWPTKGKLIDAFITRNGKLYGRRNAQEAISRAKEILALITPQRDPINIEWTDEASSYPTSFR